MAPLAAIASDSIHKRPVIGHAVYSKEVKLPLQHHAFFQDPKFNEGRQLGQLSVGIASHTDPVNIYKSNSI